MQIITTHINADFDSLASMIAAQKLYPEAKLVFPGSMEANLRLFLKAPEYHIPFLKMRDISLEEINLLVLVDTKLARRIGKLARILDRPDLQIHIYDHHPSQTEDIHGTLEMIKPYGSTSTILVELLRQQGIEISPREATLIALGIYEDTGSFTFTSTTPEDLQAVSFLLSCGADLNVISDVINRNLTAEQISLLNLLLQSLERYTIHGVEVVIASATTDQYAGDVAILAHEINDIENAKALFVIAQIENRIHLVARSRISGVDVGEVAHAFGGGGHHHAASATIHNQPLAQCKESLLEVLSRCIKPAIIARDIMSSPVKAIQETLTIDQGKSALHRYNINTLPVLNQHGQLAGLITRQTIDRAIRHGMGNSPVKDFMQSDLITIDEKADIDQIRENMIESNQRFLPVLQKGHLIGAITKTDLLRALHDHMLQLFPSQTALDSATESHVKNVRNILEDRLPQRVFSTLQIIGQAADELGVSVYAVGGFVRDLLLHVDNYDIDLVTEGNGILFAEYLAAKVHGRIRAHRRFGTAVVIFPDGFKIDIATARTEYYERPVALPRIELSSLKHDLYRRDFSINALAIQLNSLKFGQLIDFFGGRRDLKDKKIRVLHSLSFIEDPTRVFRAIRFEQRYGFKIGQNTLSLLNNAVRMDLLTKLQGYRLFCEIYLILQEENPLKAINRMRKLNLLKYIHPQIHGNEQLFRLLLEIKKVVDWYHLLYLEDPIKDWLLYFAGLTDQLSFGEFYELCHQLKISLKYISALTQIKVRHQEILKSLSFHPQARPSQIYGMLNPFSLEALLYAMAKGSEKSKKTISHYLTTLKSTKISLRGIDLKTMGYRPGPIFRQIMQALLEAKLDGAIKTRQDEVDYVKKFFSTHTLQTVKPESRVKT
ncbi:MAG: CBS domain-containing protein [bacterium]